MQNKNITLIGAGALGSHLALLTRNLGARLTVIDFDRVERKNTLSQFHTRMGVGRNKAQALAQSLQGLYGVQARAVPHKLTADNVEALLGDAALVLDCVDNAPARRVIQKFAQARGLPCLHGALAADGAFGRVIWSEHFKPDEGQEGQATCEDGQHLPFIVTVAAYMAQSVQRFLEQGQRHSFQVFPGGAQRLA
jgi:molybdopterin/thiamine biosynthesis adenylyltransferase